jgi:O-succinylbenzoate synthase
VERALALAEACALPVVVSGSLDTSIGLASGLWLAGSLPGLPFACGLGTGVLFSHDVVSSPQQVVDGHLMVRRSVPEDVDPCGLVDDVMRERWRARLMRAWQHARIPAAVKAS